jgi:hypothetical protein
MISERAADVAIPDLPLPVLYHDHGGEKHEPVSLHAATSPPPLARPSSSSDAASPSSGSNKRFRSPSPPPARDAPSAIEHEGPAMSGKSPGTKRRRLEAPASSPDAQTGAAVATAKATAKRVLEIEDSSDSYVSPFVASPLRHISIPGARSVTPPPLTSWLLRRKTKARLSLPRESRFPQVTRTC